MFYLHPQVLPNQLTKDQELKSNNQRARFAQNFAKCLNFIKEILTQSLNKMLAFGIKMCEHQWLAEALKPKRDNKIFFLTKTLDQ